MTGNLKPLMLIPAASRCLSAFCVTALRPIGHSEYASLSKNMGTPLAAAIMLLLTVAIGWIWLGAESVICLAAIIAGYAAAMAWAVHTMKGVSGDLAGYALCVGELCGLTALAVF